MAACPSKSPEANIRCRLPDDRHYHGAGHEARIKDGTVVWATTPEEQKRWLEMESTDG